MNKLTNKLFTNVVNFTTTPSAIAKAADKLLSRILPEENAAAVICFIVCGGCFLRLRVCRRCCRSGSVTVCYPRYLVRC